MALIGKYLCYAMLALSLDLVWGYCGILSLGHRRLLRAGRLCHGMYLMRQIGSRGVYGNPIFRFHGLLNWTELPGTGTASTGSPLPPSWCCSFRAFSLSYLAFFAFRSRVSGVHLSIITQA